MEKEWGESERERGRNEVDEEWMMKWGCRDGNKRIEGGFG